MLKRILIVIMLCLSLGACGSGVVTSHQPSAPSPTIDIHGTLVAAQRYSARVPGPCDTGRANWYIYPEDQNASFICLTDRLQETQDRQGAEQPAPSVYFEGQYTPSGSTTLPPNYRMSIRVLSLSSRACATIMASHEPVGFSSDSGYIFRFCQDGLWSIITPLQHISSHSVSRTTFGLTTIVTKTTKQLVIDGMVIATLTDVEFIAPHYIALGLVGPDGAKSSVQFSQFVYEPQTAVGQ